MQILFLGTSSARASLTRGNSAALLKYGGNGLLIDCGEGVSRALLERSIPLDAINSVFISHFHADHSAGLPGLITRMKLEGRTIPLNIYLHKNLEESLWQMLNLFLLFKENIPFALEICGVEEGHVIDYKPGVSFKCLRNSHLANKYQIGYVPEERFVSAGFLFSLNNISILFTSDIEDIKDILCLEEKLDYIITEAAHIPPEKLLQAFVKYEPEKIIVTHIVDENKIDLWYANLDKKIKKFFIVAFDGMEILL